MATNRYDIHSIRDLARNTLTNFTVQFLGSGDAFGSGGRFQTCIYVDAGQTRFLFDCGASSLVAMKRFGVAPSGRHILLGQPFSWGSLRWNSILDSRNPNRLRTD